MSGSRILFSHPHDYQIVKVLMLLAGNPLPISGLVSTQRIALPVGNHMSVPPIQLPIQVKREFFTVACSIL